MGSAVIEVSDENFAKEVLETRDQLVVVEFSTVSKVNTRGAENASAKMDKVIDALAADPEYASRAKYVRVPIELDAALESTCNAIACKVFGINHGPTLVFVRSRQEVGGQSEERVRALIDDFRGALS